MDDGSTPPAVAGSGGLLWSDRCLASSSVSAHVRYLSALNQPCAISAKWLRKVATVPASLHQ